MNCVGPAKRKLARKNPDAGTSTCLSRPASLVLASQTPASPRPVPPCPSQSTTPPIRRRPNLFPSFTPSACFLSATCLSHPPAMGAGPLTRLRRRSVPDKASLQSPACPFSLLNRSRVAESAATRCRTKRQYLSPLSRPRRWRWETASSRLLPTPVGLLRVTMAMPEPRVRVRLHWTEKKSPVVSGMNLEMGRQHRVIGAISDVAI